jgi:hypothetical protein
MYLEVQLEAGWQDEFVKKIAQNVAQPIFLPKLKHNRNCGKKWPKNVGYICYFQKTAQSKQ